MLKAGSPWNSFWMAASFENTCRNSLTRLVLAGVLEKFCGFTMETLKWKLAVTSHFLLTKSQRTTTNHSTLQSWNLPSLPRKIFLFLTLKKCFNSHTAKPEHLRINWSDYNRKTSQTAPQFSRNTLYTLTNLILSDFIQKETATEFINPC